jgi:hypothetical protein
MLRRRHLIYVMATTILTLTAVAPVGAQSFSCVGWFASTNAQADAREFAATISGAAHEARPFGWSTVAPFAHLPLEICQGE